MPKQLKSKINDLKRDEIIRVAGNLFYQNGFTKTSVEDIATALSVGKPFIYSFFPSKADLLADVCNRVTSFAADLAVYALNDEGPFTERLDRIVRQLCLRVIEGHLYLAVLFREEKHMPSSAVKQLTRNRHAFKNAVTKLLDDGKRAGEFKFQSSAAITELAITGMITWVFTWYQERGALKPEQIADEMSSLVMDMVRARVPANPNAVS